MIKSILNHRVNMEKNWEYIQERINQIQEIKNDEISELPLEMMMTTNMASRSSQRKQMVTYMAAPSSQREDPMSMTFMASPSSQREKQTYMTLMGAKSSQQVDLPKIQPQKPPQFQVNWINNTESFG